MMAYEGLSRSNIAQQSSKGSLFTSFEDVEVRGFPTMQNVTFYQVNKYVSKHQSSLSLIVHHLVMDQVKRP